MPTINYRKAALGDGTYGEGMAGERGRLSLQDLVDLVDAPRDRFDGDEELWTTSCFCIPWRQ